MRRVKRAIVWLSRIRYCRGFGIQSPNDYRFVRYVVNEHYPYYAYADLARSVAGIDTDERRLCMLYFRLANEVQPRYYIDIMPSDDSSQRYVRAGCHHTETVVCKSMSQLDELKVYLREPSLVRFSCMAEALPTDEVFDEMLSSASSSTVIVVEGIYQSKARNKIWHRMAAHQRVGVSYDLYYCGILLLEDRRYQIHYKVNF